MGTPRTQAELQTIFADNNTGDITPADMRDFATSIPNLGDDFLYSYATPATSGNIHYNGTDTININTTDANGNDNTSNFAALFVDGNVIKLTDTISGAILHATITNASLTSSVYTLTITSLASVGTFVVTDFVMVNVSFIPLSGFVPTSTTVTAGTGLTGGGALSSDITLNVGTIAIANGGTGHTTANTALNALLPSQASNSGDFLTTDGTNTSWAAAGGLPSQTGHSGYVLTTNGSAASWTTAPTGLGALSCVTLSVAASAFQVNNTGAISVASNNMYVDVSGNIFTNAGCTVNTLSAGGGSFLVDHLGHLSCGSINGLGSAGDVQVNIGGIIQGQTPVADGTYTVGIGSSTNGTITITNGVITSVVQAS